MRHSCVVLAVSCSLSLSLLFGAPALAANSTTIRVASGLEQPVYITAPPGDNSRLFIVEANSGGVANTTDPTKMIARIKILNLTGPNAGKINATPFLTINGIPQREDQGLFNLAFHPNYAQNGLFYITYAFGNAGGQSRVERYHVSANPDIADAASATTIFSYFKPYHNHSGDWLGFSPTDVAQGKYYLYHTTGDGGSGNDPDQRAQDLSGKYGKLLRVDVGANGLADAFPADPATNYAIPPDNPFINTPGADPSIWALGFRNPWRASFDRLTGDLYIGHVGQNAAEELEFQPFDSDGGENYGWSRLEGTLPGPHPGPATPADVGPMYQKFHDGNYLSGHDRSVTGGYVYRGPIQELQGQYIFGDFLGNYNFNNGTGTAQIFSFRYDGSDPSTFNGSNIVNDQVLNRTTEFAPRVGTINFISSFGEDAEGNLYIVDMGNLGTPDGLGKGEVYKIVDLLFGDLNGDHMITPVDWSLFKAGQGSVFTGLSTLYSYLLGDLDGDRDHDLHDFVLFRTAYEDFNGAGSFAALDGLSEPSCVALGLLGSIGIGMMRRRA
jgi:glucose/arabinose dehydrogenase